MSCKRESSHYCKYRCYYSWTVTIRTNTYRIWSVIWTSFFGRHTSESGVWCASFSFMILLDCYWIFDTFQLCVCSLAVFAYMHNVIKVHLHVPKPPRADFHIRKRKQNYWVHCKIYANRRRKYNRFLCEPSYSLTKVTESLWKYQFYAVHTPHRCCCRNEHRLERETQSIFHIFFCSSFITFWFDFWFGRW